MTAHRSACGHAGADCRLLIDGSLKLIFRVCDEQGHAAARARVHIHRGDSEKAIYECSES